MAEGKSIDLNLRIISTLQGMNVYSKLSAAMGTVVKQAGLANVTLGKLAAGTAAVVLGYKGLESIGHFMGDAMKEATAAVKAEEKLGIALSRNPKLAKLGADVVKDQQEKLIELAEQMERSGVQTATGLKAGFAGMSAAGFGPAKIAQYSKGFEGMVTALKGVGAEKADVADVAQSLRLMIKTGRLPREMAGKLGISKDDIKAFTKMKSERERAAFAMKLLEKQEWRVGAALETTEGKVWRSQQAWHRLGEIIGRPFVDTQTAFAEAIGSLGEALEPAAHMIAESLTPALAGLAKWLRESKPMIQSWGQNVANAFQWIIDNWQPISRGLEAIAAGFGALLIINALLNPMTWIVAGFTALAGAIMLVVDNWDLIAPAAESAWEAVQSTWGGALDWIKTTFGPMAEELAKIWGPVGEKLSKLWDDVSGAMSISMEDAMIVLQEYDWGSLFGDIGGAIQQTLTSIDWGGIFLAMGEKAISNATAFAQNLYNIISGALSKINWSGLLSSIQSIDWGGIFSSLGSTAATNASSLATTIGDTLKSIDWNSIAKIVGEGLGNALKSLAIGVIDLGLWTTQLEMQFSNAISNANWYDIVSKISEGIDNALTGVVNFGLNVGTSLLDGIVKGITGQDMGQITTAFINGFNNTWNSISSLVSGWGPKIISLIQAGLSNVVVNIIPNLLGIGNVTPQPTGASEKSAAGVSNALAPVPAPAMQLGGLVGSPGLRHLAERGPEMVIPMQGDSRSRGLLSRTATALGMGGMLAGAGGGGVSLTMNVPITINGAGSGHEEALGREIQRAMQDPINALLQQLRKAKDEEQRLAYV